VQVRTGEVIDLPGGQTVPNVIALEYSGASLGNSRWLQFVWFELNAVTPRGVVPIAGNVPTTSGNKPFTTSPATPNWTVDSASAADPFYEAAGANIRTTSSTTIFDAPGGETVISFAQSAFNNVRDASKVSFTAHFDTYLIQNDRAAYRVAWSASTPFLQVRGVTFWAGLVGYTIAASAATTAIPSDLLKILHVNYPTFSRVQ
jgi:hypothetical protein